MRQSSLLILAAFLWGVGCAGADELAGSGKRTLLRSPGIVFCDAAASVEIHEASGRLRVSTPSGFIQIVPQAEGLLIQYPDQTLRLRRTPAERGTEILVQFGGKNYRIFERKRECEWQFPDEQAFFQLSSGSLRQVLGDRGTLGISGRAKAGLYYVTSEAGESRYRIVRASQGGPSSVETVEGEPPERHGYLARGVLFQEGPVGVFIPLPGGPLVAALDWASVRRYEAPLPTLKAPAPPPPAESDPLVAAPAEWRSQALEAAPAPAGEDPINLMLKPAPPVDRSTPLKAVTAPDSEELLRVKDFQP